MSGVYDGINTSPTTGWCPPSPAAGAKHWNQDWTAMDVELKLQALHSSSPEPRCAGDAWIDPPKMKISGRFVTRPGLPCMGWCGLVPRHEILEQSGNLLWMLFFQVKTAETCCQCHWTATSTTAQIAQFSACHCVKSQRFLAVLADLGCLTEVLREPQTLSAEVRSSSLAQLTHVGFFVKDLKLWQCVDNMVG